MPTKTGLRARREAAGLSREKLARLADCCVTTLVQLEGARPSEAMAQRIADALDCQPSDLFEQVSR